MILVVVFLWIASPVASHMLARFEVATNENLDKDCALPIEKEKQKNKGKGAAL
jgi:multicomponent Na+:H+ antiporter subunit G